jgi:hypothetical protein
VKYSLAELHEFALREAEERREALERLLARQKTAAERAQGEVEKMREIARLLAEAIERDPRAAGLLC